MALCRDYRPHPSRHLVLRSCRAPSFGDVMLAQKLALETDEQAALAVANRSRC